MNDKNKGFSLIEILVVIGVFSGLVTVITGIFVSNLRMQRKAMATQRTLGEISYVMEYINRTARMAITDDAGDCIGSDNAYYTYDVPGGDDGVGEALQFMYIDENREEKCVRFFLDEDDGVMKKGIREGGDWSDYDLTSGFLDIRDFYVYVNVHPDGDGTLYEDQPSATVHLEVEETDIGWWDVKLQSTITRRSLDIERDDE